MLNIWEVTACLQDIQFSRGETLLGFGLDLPLVTTVSSVHTIAFSVR